jgi:DNA-binding transcriptional LysR family regulator
MTLIDRVSHRLKLRDLRLLESVIQYKSMARAAAHLNLTQPAVSKAISELEHTLGVRLVDRSRHGVEPTAHGLALIRRSTAIFDELRQGVDELEHLSDPTAGAIRIAASVPMAAGALPVIIDRLSRRYPRMSIQAREVLVNSLPFQTPPHRELRDRAVDLVFGPYNRRMMDEDLEVEPLFQEPLVVAVGKQNPWAKRKTVTLHDLRDEQWCLPAPDSVAGQRCVQAFRAAGMGIPRKTVTTISIYLQLGLLGTPRFLTMFPGSLMQFSSDRFAIRKLPIDLAIEPMSNGIVTLKGRTMSPATRLFIQMAREVTKPMASARR